MNDPLSVMRMESLLQRKEELREMDWAQKICTAGRFLHKDVWTMPLDRGYVEFTVLPLFSGADKALRDFTHRKDISPEDKNQVEPYIRNNTLRVKNIRDNFLKGKRSALVPDDKISEPKKRHA